MRRQRISLFPMIALALTAAASCVGRSAPLDGAGSASGGSGGAGGRGCVAAGQSGSRGDVLPPEEKAGRPSCVVVDTETSRTTVEKLCGESCLTPEEVVANIEPTCPRGRPVERVLDGCGYVVIEHSVGFAASTFVYDRETRELVGLRSYSHQPWGPCNTTTYEAGILPRCEEATICHICPTEDHDAGAGGQGGRSGADCLPF